MEMPCSEHDWLVPADGGRKRLLVIHRDFPGPFRALLPIWSERLGWQVDSVGSVALSGCDYVAAGTHSIENAVRHGESVGRALLDLRTRNYRPDAVLADPEAGGVLCVKDVFPDSRLVLYCAGHAGESGCDAVHDLSAVACCDAGISPGWWQKRSYPQHFQPKIHVIRDGLCRGAFGRDRCAVVVTDDGRTLRTGDAVVSHVMSVRGRAKGLSTFLRVLGLLQRRHHCQALIVGVSDDETDWLEQRMVAACVDPQRTHLVRHPGQDGLADLLRVSAVHIHPGGQGCLDRSLLEAMACGCAVVVADEPQLREVVRHGVNGLLVDPLDIGGIADAVLHLFDSPLLQDSLRREAQFEISTGFDAGAAAIRYARVFEGQPDGHGSPHFLPAVLAGDDVTLRDYAFCALGAT